MVIPYRHQHAAGTRVQAAAVDVGLMVQIELLHSLGLGLFAAQINLF